MAIMTVFLGALLLSFNHPTVSEGIEPIVEVNTTGQRGVGKSPPSLADDRRDGWDDHDNDGRRDNDRWDHDDDRHDRDDDRHDRDHDNGWHEDDGDHHDHDRH